MERNVIHQMDALTLLQMLPDASINCCVTSPPYYGLRSYGAGAGEMGSEDSPQAFVARLVAVLAELRRVLRSDGTVWLNLGDSYSGSGKGGDLGIPTDRHTYSPSHRAPQLGYKPKDLMGMPWRVAFALQDDGWWLRSDIIWHKPNPMPESVTDRPTKAHEYIFLLTKRAKYFYDADAIRETNSPNKPWGATNGSRTADAKAIHGQHGTSSIIASKMSHEERLARYNSAGRNKRSVWTIPTQPNPLVHFASFPEKLVEPCVLAGCPKAVCVECGSPVERVVEKPKPPEWAYTKARQSNDPNVRVSPLGQSGKASGGKMQKWLDANPAITTGWHDGCQCQAAKRPGVVLDMFAGTGTVGMVARRHGRDYVLGDLSEKYVAMARDRLRQPFERLQVKADNDVSDLPLFKGLADDAL